MRPVWSNAWVFAAGTSCVSLWFAVEQTAMESRARNRKCVIGFWISSCEKRTTPLKWILPPRKVRCRFRLLFDAVWSAISGVGEKQKTIKVQGYLLRAVYLSTTKSQWRERTQWPVVVCICVPSNWCNNFRSIFVHWMFIRFESWSNRLTYNCITFISCSTRVRFKVQWRAVFYWNSHIEIAPTLLQDTSRSVCNHSLWRWRCLQKHTWCKVYLCHLWPCNDTRNGWPTRIELPESLEPSKHKPAEGFVIYERGVAFKTYVLIV